MSAPPEQLERPLGLNRHPFSPRVEDDFFFADQTRTRQLNILVHLAQHSELLMMLTGVQGIGKTTLLRQFVRMGEDNWRVCFMTGFSSTDRDSLLNHLCHEFEVGIAAAEPGECMDALWERCLSMKMNGLVPILVVDDAHVLPEDALQTLLDLSELADDEGKLLKIIVSSEPLREDMLSSPLLAAMRERTTHSLEIPVLEEEETGAYLAHRLRVAGFDRGPLFTESQIRKIWRNSRGIPAQINKAARDTMLGIEQTAPQVAEAQQPPLSPTPRPRRARGVLALAAILATAAAISALILKDGFERFEQHPAEPTGLGGRAAGNAQETVVLGPPDRLPISRVRPGAAEAPAQSTAPAIVAAEPPPAPVQETPPEATIEPAAEVEPPAGTATAPPAGEPAFESGSGTEQTAAEPGPEAPAVLTPPPAAGGQTPATATETAPDGEHRRWLSTQDPAHYTLQIMASYDRRSLEKALRRSGLTDKSVVIPTRRGERIWYIAAYGTYPGRQAAAADIARLPAAIRKARPWPKRIGDITPAPSPQAGPEASAAPQTVPTSAGGMRREQWLLGQDPGHFTIMLLGTHREGALLDYARDLGREAAYFQTVHNERPWYVLLYGIYPSRPAAVAEAARLRNRLTASAWVRDLSGVHADIARR